MRNKLRPFLSRSVCAAVLLSGAIAQHCLASTITNFQSSTRVLSGGTEANFDNYARGTLITTQYAGMVFSQTGGGVPQIDTPPYLYAYGSSSGTGVLTGSQQGTNVFPTIAGIIVSFTTPQSAVQAFFSDTAPLGAYPISIYSGIGGTGTLLSTFTIPRSALPGTGPLPGYYVGFLDSVAEIGSFQLGPGQASNDAFAVDDVSFGGRTSAVAVTPEPASWLLLGTGVLSMAGTFKRRLQA